MQELFEIITTEDGSPSLRLAGGEMHEIMHHSGGAFSETQYIYIDPLRWAARQGARRVVSIGLGLGYHELGFLKVSSEESFMNTHKDSFELLSFESSEQLRECFMQHLSRQQNYLSHSFADAAARYEFQQTRWLQDLQQALEQKKINILGSLTQPFVKIEQGYEVVMYDAFSRKTSPELWEPQFLNSFIDHFCAPDCVWLTYACLGALKQTLKSQGFDLWVRPGFKGKRNATWAVRGRFGDAFKSLKTS